MYCWITFQSLETRENVGHCLLSTLLIIKRAGTILSSRIVGRSETSKIDLDSEMWLRYGGGKALDILL
jgi:hypothetical protein